MIYVDPSETIKKLKEMKAKRILLQLPDGLKPRVFDYFTALSKEFNVIVSSEGFYGACDIGTMDVYGKVDCIVQLGHSRIPNIDYPIPVIFEEYLEKAQEDFSNVDFSILKESGYSKIGILYSIQYKNTEEIVSEYLRSLGYDVQKGKKDNRLAYDGRVLGCNY
ncbi:diphthamide synthase subunit DPH2, partial [mine drainage metagenome]